MANLYTKFEVSSISRTGIARGVTFQNGSHDSDHAPFQVWFFFHLTEWDLLWSTCIPNLKLYKNLKSGAKCRNCGGSIFYRFRDIANHLSKVADFYLPHPHFMLPYLVTPVEFRGRRWRQKTRFPGLSQGVVCVILCLAVLTQYRLVTDGQTDTRRQHIPR